MAIAAAITIGLGIWYLHWRWTSSLNPNALLFSISVAAAETAAFIGTILFVFDTWAEGDTRQATPPVAPRELGLEDENKIVVDIFITTFDEGVEIVGPTLFDASQLQIPNGVDVNIALLDDGGRPEMEALAERFGVFYFARSDNRGFKAGNLRHALIHTKGDFFVICDADTRVFPTFLQNTMGYSEIPELAGSKPHTGFTTFRWPHLKQMAFCAGSPRQGHERQKCWPG